MIVDSLVNIGSYSSIPFCHEIQQYLQARKPEEIPDGEEEICGRDLYLKVFSYTISKENTPPFESHRQHADLQLIVRGRERIQVVNRRDAAIVKEYDPQGDYELLSAAENISDIFLNDGDFALFYPGELHKPGCQCDTSRTHVKKLVFKIRCGQDRIRMSRAREDNV